ncbi:MAG: aspartate aminotransferase family protein [Acidimicrobiales bacterium]
MSPLSPLLHQATGIMVARGEGAYLIDTDGRSYLDFTSGIGVTSTGHCHPRVVEAIQRQAGELIHGQYTTVLHRPLVELAERIGGLTPAPIDSIFFASAGTEAVEASVRLARHATGRPNIIAFHGGFHGRTMGSASLTTSKVSVRAGLQPLMGGVVITPFPYAYRYGWSEEEAVSFCLREFDYLLDTVTAPEETAAVILEPELGEGGYVPTPPGFAAGIRERCDQYGMLLIADEIQTGAGRTGRFWGHEHLGIVPDMIVMAKGIASGMPLSALAAPSALMSKAWAGSQGGTYGGNALSCVAALATLDVIAEERLVERAAEQGYRLIKGLRALAADYPQIDDVRGLGLMIGAEIVDAEKQPDGKAARELQLASVDEGLLLLTCGPHANVVRFIPPLIVESSQVDQAVDAFSRALKVTSKR